MLLGEVIKKMDHAELLESARPHLEKHDWLYPHTRRVLDIAVANYDVPKELRDLVFASITLHDVGGRGIQNQYEKGPEIAAPFLRSLGYSEAFVQEVCQIIRTHHDRPDDPSLAFKVLYDSDKLVMLTPEEFPNHDSRPNINWEEIIGNMYIEHSKRIAREWLQLRRQGR